MFQNFARNFLSSPFVVKFLFLAIPRLSPQPIACDAGKKTLGPDHPDLATRFINRAVLLTKQVRGIRNF